MNLGVVVKPAVAAPGRLLLRNDGKRVEFLITTAVLDPNDRGQKMVVAFRTDMPVGYVHATALNRQYWDVTDIAVLRPRLTSHQFSDDYEKHGDVFLTEKGELLMAGEYKSAGSVGGYIHFDISTGAQATANTPFSVCFNSWDIVAREKQGEAEVKLFSWTSKGMPKSSSSY